MQDVAATTIRIALMLLAFFGSIGVLAGWLTARMSMPTPPRMTFADALIPTVVVVIGFALVAAVFRELVARL